MRPLLPLLMALVLPAVGGCATQKDAFAPPAPGYAVPVEEPVSLVVERPGGEQFGMFPYGNAMYVAGDEGSRYNLRLVNNTASRVEAVVTVDGRDVVSGELGNYKKQRGYVLEPFGSVVIEGFRTSLNSVAAFRFASVGQSYTTQRGTPQHVGVIGVALFKEKERKEKAPIAVAPAPYYSARRKASPGKAARQPFPESEPAAGDDAAFEQEAGADADGAFAPSEPAPTVTPHHELGTEYGESQHSAVHQVEFRRHRKRKPDGYLTLYYDSLRGLEARGIIPSQTHNIGFGDPDPFPAG